MPTPTMSKSTPNTYPVDSMHSDDELLAQLLAQHLQHVQAHEALSGSYDWLSEPLYELDAFMASMEECEEDVFFQEKQRTVDFIDSLMEVNPITKPIVGTLLRPASPPADAFVCDSIFDFTFEDEVLCDFQVAKDAQPDNAQGNDHIVDSSLSSGETFDLENTHAEKSQCMMVVDGVELNLVNGRFDFEMDVDMDLEVHVPEGLDDPKHGQNLKDGRDNNIIEAPLCDDNDNDNDEMALEPITPPLSPERPQTEAPLIRLIGPTKLWINKAAIRRKYPPAVAGPEVVVVAAPPASVPVIVSPVNVTVPAHTREYRTKRRHSELHTVEEVLIAELEEAQQQQHPSKKRKQDAFPEACTDAFEDVVMETVIGGGGGGKQQPNNPGTSKPAGNNPHKRKATNTKPTAPAPAKRLENTWTRRLRPRKPVSYKY